MRLPRKLNKWEPVVVEWEDVYSHGGTKTETKLWKTVDDVHPCIRRTIGFVIQYFYGKYIFIAETDDTKHALDSRDDVENVTQIPIEYIRSLKRLSRP